MAHDIMAPAQQAEWQAEPPTNVSGYTAITRRLNWLRTQVEGIDAQLAERRSEGDTAWRRRAVNAKNYRLAELREQRLRRSQTVNPSPSMRGLMKRVLALMEELDGLDDADLSMVEEVKQCLS